MRKLLIVSLLLFGAVFGGFRALPWVSGWWVAWQCSGGTAAESCPARIRAMGHTWAARDDLDRAGSWYLRGARAGDTEAMFHIGWVYHQIALRLQREDVQRRLARHMALPSADPNLHLSSLETQDADMRKYAEAAIAWYRKSAESGFAPAMNNLGLMVSLGLDGQPDEAEAFRCYLAAAEAGNPIASMNLMLAYLSGRGTARDPQAAVKWSLWRPTQGLTDDLKSPTLRRTLLVGSPERPSRVEDKLRTAAQTGQPLVLGISPRESDDALLAFADMRAEPSGARW